MSDDEQKGKKKGIGISDPFTMSFEFAWDLMAMPKKAKLALTRKVTILPALTVMIFLRSKLGYRMVTPSYLLIMSLFLVLFPKIMVSLPYSSYSYKVTAEINKEVTIMAVFVVAMIGLSLVNRWQRKNDFKQGNLWHTYSEGISRFSGFLPINESLCNRFVDPVFCLSVGIFTIYTISLFLGYWLVFAAFCLFHWEGATNEARMDNLLDQLDAYCDSEAHEKSMSHFTDKKDKQGETPPPLSRNQTAGVPTGLAPDIEASLQRRKNRKPPPDDLAG